MKDVVYYKPEMSAKEVLNRFGLVYSKYSEWGNRVLEEEHPVIINALKKFTEEVGLIPSKNKTFEAVFVEFASTPYIGFRNVTEGQELWSRYDDLDEIDRRYIKLKEREWLDS